MSSKLLFATMNELEQNHQEVDGILAKRDADWRRQLIQARRRLSASIGDMAKLLDGQAVIKAAPTEVARARQELSKFRRVAALHQACYPAVAIDDLLDDYAASAERVRESHLQFCGLIRQFLESGAL